MSRKTSLIFVAAVLAVGSVACATATAAAGPLDRRVLPARAGAVLHVDIDAVKASKLWRRLSPELPGVAKLETSLADNIHGWPLPVDAVVGAVLHATGVTIWVDGAGKHGALIADGIDGPVLVALARAAPGVVTHRHDGRTIYTLGKGQDNASVAIVGDRAIVSSGSGGVAATLDALAGKRRARIGAILSASAAGKLFFVAVLDRHILAHVQKHASSSLLKSGTLTRLSLAVGERGDNLFVTARAGTSTAKDAAQIERVVDGMLALAQLAVHAPTIQKIVDATRLRRRGKRISLDVSVPVDALVRLVDHNVKVNYHVKVKYHAHAK